MRPDELLEQLAALDPVRGHELPDPESDAAQRLLALAMQRSASERRTDSILARRPALLVAAVATVAAAAVLASPPGQSAVRAAVDEVSSWFGGEATIVGTDDGEPVAQLHADGIVTSAVSDGRGGWYIAGGFTMINGEPRAHLAHILGDGTVDPDWKPELGGNAKPPYIYATLARADDLLYLAGTFSTVNGRALGNVVALDAQTGNLASDWQGRFNAQGGGNFALATDGTRVYVGVAGRAIADGEVRDCLIALDARTGRLERQFSPRLAPPGGLVCVTSLALRDGTLFASGTFAQGSNDRRATVVALDATTGAALPAFESPTLFPQRSAPLALAASSDKLYVGGAFEVINGDAHRGIVALDARTGTPVQSFDAAVTTGSGDAGSVFSLLLDDERLYLGGNFDAVSGEKRNGFAALDATSGLLLATDAVPPHDYVLALALSGRGLLAGGKSGAE